MNYYVLLRGANHGKPACIDEVKVSVENNVTKNLEETALKVAAKCGRHYFDEGLASRIVEGKIKRSQLLRFLESLNQNAEFRVNDNRIYLRYLRKNRKNIFKSDLIYFIGL